MAGNYKETEEFFGNIPFMIIIEESENPDDWFVVRFTDDQGEYVLATVTDERNITYSKNNLDQALELSYIVKSILEEQHDITIMDENMKIRYDAIASNAQKGDLCSINFLKKHKKTAVTTNNNRPGTSINNAHKQN